MTVQAQDSVQYYDGPINVGAVIPITDFIFIDNSHVSLKIRGIDEIWEYGTDYTIEGADTLTRTITLNRAVEAGQVLAAYLDVPITQNISPEEGGNFPASTNEFVLDKLTCICQMLYERIIRSLQVSVDTAFDGVLYNVEENTGKAIIVNATGTGVSYSAYNINDLEAIVRRIFQSIPEIDAVGDNIGSVIIDAQNINQIKTVASSITNVNNTGNSIANVNIVGNDLALNSNSNIKKVVANKTNIDTVANNITDVQHAAENAQIAKTSAAEAKQWAIGSPTQPSGYSAKYWAEKGKTDVENLTKTAKTTIETVQGTAVKAVNSAKDPAIQVIGADVISANNAADRAQESAMKAIGWNITYTDEDILDFTDLTPEEIETNLSYIGEARESAIGKVNEARDSAIINVNQAAQAAKLSETEAKRAELAAQNSENSANNWAAQSEVSAGNSAASANQSQTAKQQAEAAATNANTSATNAANTLTQVRSITETATQVTGSDVVAANEAANRAQDFAMKSLGWDIKYEDEDSLDFSSNAASFEAKLKALPGYSETGTQVLKSVNGALQWVTE